MWRKKHQKLFGTIVYLTCKQKVIVLSLLLKANLLVLFHWSNYFSSVEKSWKISRMASKFRNLIASKLRKQLRCGGEVATSSLRLQKGGQPFALTLPAPQNVNLEGFETDHFIPSVTSDGAIWTFHLPQKEFTREVLKEGLRRDYSTYNVGDITVFVSTSNIWTFVRFLKFI